MTKAKQQQQQHGSPIAALPRRKSTLRAYVSDEWGRSHVVLGVFAALLHALGCIFYFGMARLHLFIKSEPQAVLTLSFTGIDLLVYFNAVIAASLALGVLHALAIFGPCYWAIVSNRLSSRVYAGDESSARPRQGDAVAPPRSRWRRIQRKFAKWGRTLESTTGADSYELLVVVEIGLQTYQAHKMSRLVTAHWINRLMALAIVANCWIVPGVSVVFRKKPPSFIKVVQLALDAMIELVYGMVIPLVIFYPYYRDATRILYDKPYDGWYDDAWYIQAAAENLQLFISSWLDFVSKMAPGLSLLLRLFAFQAQRTEHEVRTRTASLEMTAHASSARQKKRFVNALMALWGLAVLTAHIVATGVYLAGRDPSCLLEPIPLGSTQYSCAVLEVSCSQRRISGSKSDIDATLSHMDPLTVQALIFSHCESLSMPTRLKTFTNLIEIKIHNVSIAEWGDDAALTAQDHPIFKVLYITLTNMSAIPDGLLSADPPPLLVDIEFCGTNLTGIPDDVFERWPTLSFFGLENSPGITAFPRALLSTDSSPKMLSLSSDSIVEIPDDIFVGREYQLLFLMGNPIERLPDEVGSAPASSFVSFAATKVTTVPAVWMAATDQFVASGCGVAATSTPLCSSLLEIRAQKQSGAGNDDATTLPWILCDDASAGSPLVYPLEFEKRLRAASRG